MIKRNWIHLFIILGSIGLISLAATTGEINLVTFLLSQITIMMLCIYIILLKEDNRRFNHADN